MEQNNEKIVINILGTFRRVMASIKNAEETLEKMFKELGIIDYVFIGGTSTIHHGYVRTTTDIDVIVSSKDFDKIFEDLDRLINYGFEAESEGALRHKDGTKIEFLVEEGYFLQDPGRQVPKLSELPRDKDSRFVDFETHLKLKSMRGSLKDLADIAELLKIKHLPENELLSILNQMNGRQKQSFKRALQGLKEEDNFYKNLKLE